MRKFRADLHIHSRFSRATSSRLSVPLLAAWARIKGLSVLGTGDFTHPKWREELERSLRLDERSGLYLLRDPASAQAALPEVCLPDPEAVADQTGTPPGPVHFMLQGEISSIYKRGGKVRKVHNLVFMPDLPAAEKFSKRLEAIGNLHSDGRPILGLDSRDLLELVLETDHRAFLIPAHIWTPWFALFGSKSGFDSLEECFGDLASEIFALETGLSSDPPMNRLWSELDGCRLISNSDAHSGENLGREANCFSGEISYQGLLDALRHPEKPNDTRFLGTLEFYPEEGKYHLDGHRKCNVVLSPEETRRLGGICPVCGGPVTVGVLNRVMALADRSEPSFTGFETAAGSIGDNGFASLVPLPELLSEIAGTGPKTRRVTELYAKAIARFGSELSILQDTEVEELSRFLPPLGEAVDRMRRGIIELQGGYDGEYGVVKVFSEAERREVQRGAGFGPKGGGSSVRGLSLLGEEVEAPAKRSRRKRQTGVEENQQFTFQDARGNDALIREETLDTMVHEPGEDTDLATGQTDVALQPEDGAEIARPFTESLDQGQEMAVEAGPGPILVLAGPGTGKTKTLVARVQRLLDRAVSPRKILAVTFTRRAASEMDERLAAALAGVEALPRTDTLHAIALELWHRTNDTVPVLLSEESARQVFAEANNELSGVTLKDAWQAIGLARERLDAPPEEYAEIAQRYFTQKAAWNLADYTDLLEFWLEQINNSLFTSPWSHVLVDEIQDLSPLQLTLIRALVPSGGEGFFGIGDPDQSIYGFRGAHGRSLEFFRESWPSLKVMALGHNYRSREGVLDASGSVIGQRSVTLSGGTRLQPHRSEPAGIFLFEAQGADSEASWVAQRVAALIGRGSHTLLDAEQPGLRRNYSVDGGEYTPGDIAVLVRTHALAAPIRKALARSGIPVSEPAVDAFWADTRVALLLREAGRMLGIAVSNKDEEHELPAFPEKILTKGPLGLAAYLSAIPPFDAIFWQSSPFKSLVRAYDTNGGWAELITWISLQDELELVRAKAEKVQILSLHAAKGLEFGVVFLPCLEDGLLPFAGPDLLRGKLEKPAHTDVDEERRLFYVGLTRARDALFLSYSGKRHLYGKELRLKPSRFLEDLPGQGAGMPSRSVLVARQELKAKQLSLF